MTVLSGEMGTSFGGVKHLEAYSRKREKQLFLMAMLENIKFTYINNPPVAEVISHQKRAGKDQKLSKSDVVIDISELRLKNQDVKKPDYRLSYVYEKPKSANEGLSQKIEEMEQALESLKMMPSAGEQTADRLRILKEKLQALKFALMLMGPQEAKSMARTIAGMVKELASIAKDLDSNVNVRVSNVSALALSVPIMDSALEGESQVSQSGLSLNIYPGADSLDRSTMELFNEVKNLLNHAMGMIKSKLTQSDDESKKLSSILAQDLKVQFFDKDAPLIV
jgi:hypothetical protein